MADRLIPKPPPGTNPPPTGPPPTTSGPPYGPPPMPYPIIVSLPDEKKKKGKKGKGK